MSTNEAAERLRGSFDLARFPGRLVLGEQLDAALAEERRHVIEQIRVRATECLSCDDLIRFIDDLSTPEQT